MKRDRVAQLVRKHLQLSGEPMQLAPRSTKKPPADYPDPIFEMTPRRRGSGWIVEVWMTASDHLTEPRPLPDHRFWVQPGGELEVEDVDPSKRRRGRRKVYPDGQKGRRVHATPADEDLAEIKRLVAATGKTESAVVAALLAKALRGVPLPW